MERGSIKRTVISGVIWSYGERIAAQGVSFIVSIILARIISPSEYGAIAIVTAIISLCNTICIGGFGNALIQKKEVDDTDYSTALWAGLAVGMILYATVFFSSKYIAMWYEVPILESVIKVMALQIPVSCINTVQQAAVSRKMEFQKFFFSTIIGTIISAFVGIGMAYGQFGIWALVGQYLTNSVIDTLVLFVTVKWKIRFVFSKKSFKSIISFGSSILVASIMTDLTAQVRTLIIGKKYTSNDLAYYNRGQQFPNLMVSNLSEVIGKVTFPLFSKYQESSDKLRNMVRTNVQILMIFMAPVMLGMAVIAKPLVTVMLTSKWDFCVPYLQLFCLYFLLSPVHSANAQVVKALGKSKAYVLRAVVLNASDLMMMMIAIVAFDSPIYMAVGAVISTIIMTIYCCVLNKKYLGYLYHEQFVDIAIPVVLACMMAIVVSLWRIVVQNAFILLALQVVTGIFVYIALILIVKPKGVKIIFELLRIAKRMT